MASAHRRSDLTTRLGVPALDHILSTALHDDPRYTEVLHGPVVEVTAASMGAGKTQLLYHIAAQTVLPSTYGISGKGAAALVFDCDGRFDTVRLRAVMRGHVIRCLRGASTTSTTTDDDDEVAARVVAEALPHVHVLRPSSTQDLIDRLDAARDEFLAPEHPSAHRHLGVIIVDSLMAYYWDDVRSGRDWDTGTETGHLPLYQALVTALRRTSARFGAVVVATTWNTAVIDSNREHSGAPELTAVTVVDRNLDDGEGEGGGSGGKKLRTRRLAGYELPPDRGLPLLVRPPLPLAWNAFVHVRLVLQRDDEPPWPKFPLVEISHALKRIQDRRREEAIRRQEDGVQCQEEGVQRQKEGVQHESDSNSDNSRKGREEREETFSGWVDVTSLRARPQDLLGGRLAMFHFSAGEHGVYMLEHTRERDEAAGVWAWRRDPDSRYEEWAWVKGDRWKWVPKPLLMPPEVG